MIGGTAIAFGGAFLMLLLTFCRSASRDGCVKKVLNIFFALITMLCAAGAAGAFGLNCFDQLEDLSEGMDGTIAFETGWYLEVGAAVLALTSLIINCCLPIGESDSPLSLKGWSHA